MISSKVAAIAIVAVLAVAAVGIGYAYSASTTSTGNTADVAYYKIGAFNNGAISTTASDYNEKFDASIEFNTNTTATGTTYAPVGGTVIASISKNVANLGSIKLIAFDQDNNPISAPANKTHAKLHIVMTTDTAADKHTINDNYTFVAKLATAFNAGDAENDGSTIKDGISVMEYSNGTYSCDLYVPTASLATGFDVSIGAYVTDDRAVTAVDTDMAYGHNTDGTTSGQNDNNVLYDATVTFSIASEAANWV